MAEQQAATAVAGQSGAMTWVATGLVGLVAGAAGFALPYFITASQSPSNPGRGRASAKQEKAEQVRPAFIQFGDLVVNLAEERLTRYVSVSLTLQVDESQQEQVSKAVEEKKAILRNWLIGYLSDKGLEDVRGTAGVNRLRREIQDQFNAILFPDGYDRIRDVLFEDFKVQ